MKKAMVIGGSGFLGSCVCDELNRQGVEITAIVNRTPLSKDYRVTLVHGGLRKLDASLIDSIRPDMIFHCARPTLPVLRRAGRFIAGLKARNYNRSVLHALQKAEHKPQLIFASGSLVYGSSDKPVKESNDFSPISYARQYHIGEQPFAEAVTKKNCVVRIVRLPWLLGKGSWFEWFYLDNIFKRKMIPVFGEGENWMEIIDVHDAARIMVELASETGSNDTLNIIGKEPMKQKDFAGLVAAVFDSKPVDHKILFGNRLEKEAIEAFTSNILLESSRRSFFDKFDYRSVEHALNLIKEKAEA